MLQTGEADLVYPMPADQIEAIKENDDVNVLAADSNIMRYVTLNMNVPELKDEKVRQAMNYAIDKDCICSAYVFRICKTCNFYSSFYYRRIRSRLIILMTLKGKRAYERSRI